MRRLSLAALAIATGAGVLLALASPSTAAPEPAHSAAAKTWLTVTIGAPTTPGPSDRTEPITARLWCDPPGGSHPHPVEACLDLRAAGGDVAAVPPAGGCGGVWQPVEITASGRFEGKLVRYSAVASNDGCARVRHGYVFRL